MSDDVCLLAPLKAFAQSLSRKQRRAPTIKKEVDKQTSKISRKKDTIPLGLMKAE
jgi:hypothetical protein